MSDALIVKKDPKVYYKEDAKEYEDAYIKEKEIQRKNTIITFNDSNDKQEDKKLSYKCSEADPYTNVVKKLILLANYDISEDMFVNSPVSFSTIKVYKTCLKRMLNKTHLKSYKQSCSGFIKEVVRLRKQGYQPIESLSDAKRDIKQIMNLNLIPLDVSAYIYEPITTETNMFTIARNSRRNTSGRYKFDIHIYEVIVDNYKLTAKQISDLLHGQVSARTVGNYVWYVKSYLKTGVKSDKCPQKLFDVMVERLNKQKEVEVQDNTNTKNNTTNINNTIINQKITYVKGEIKYVVMIDDNIYTMEDEQSIAEKVCKVISKKSPGWNVRLAKLVYLPF